MGGLLPDGGFDDFGEAVGFEAGTADEGAVDVGLAEEDGCIGGFHAAAVLNSDFVRGFRIGDFCENFADMGVGILGLLRGGIAAGADRPDGFIGDDDAGDFFGRHAGQTAAELGGENFGFAACIALFEGLADTDDGLETTGEGCVDFFVNQRVGLAENLAAFAVAQNHEADEKLAQHGGADLAGEGARHFEIHILRAEADFLGATEEFREFGDGGEGRGNHDFDSIHGFDIGAEALEVADRFGDGHVHLPVGGDNFFAHGF